MSDNVIIKVEQATVRFNLGSQKRLSSKEYITRLLNRQLFFHEFYALKDIDLTVRQGESWGIVGKNGSGKSTLLKLIAGILRPYRGQVSITGRIAPLLELGAGFDHELTGRENIMMNGLILGMTKTEIVNLFDDIVAFSELEQFLDVPLKNYSSGMKSRLGFAIATSTKPDILIADEVLATGDQDFHAKCEVRIRELLESGTTLLFVSHEPDAVRRLCSKALWLNEGTVQMVGDVDEVVTAYESNAK